jgi:hypothetical protein
MEIVLHAFFNVPLNEREWTPSSPDSFNSNEEDPGTHCVGDLVGTRS